jgi:hypothetical protein
MKTVLNVVAGVVLFFAIIFGLGYFSLNYDRFFAPRQEQLRNDTFKQSQSYNDGMAHDLENIQEEYMQASPEGKDALRAIAIRRFSVYDISKLPPDLQRFYRELKGQ